MSSDKSMAHFVLECMVQQNFHLFFKLKKNVYHTRFYLKRKESSAHCSYAARGSSYKFWLSEEDVMLLAFQLCMC